MLERNLWKKKKSLETFLSRGRRIKAKVFPEVPLAAPGSTCPCGNWRKLRLLHRTETPEPRRSCLGVPHRGTFDGCEISFFGMRRRQQAGSRSAAALGILNRMFQRRISICCDDIGVTWLRSQRSPVWPRTNRNNKKNYNSKMFVLLQNVMVCFSGSHSRFNTFCQPVFQLSDE